MYFSFFNKRNNNCIFFFLGSKINEEYEGMIVYQIPKETACSKVFNVMEKAKTDSLIEDYSIQQTSLEQV